MAIPMTDEDANLNWAKMAGYLPMPSRLETKAEEGLTLGKLKDMMAQIKAIVHPPTPFLGSMRLLPADKAMSFEHEGRQFVGAHPDFWAKFPTGDKANPLADVPIYNMDVDLRRRGEFCKALFKVMNRAILPDGWGM